MIMRSRTLSFFGCIFLLGSVALAQTPVVSTGGIVNAAGLGSTKTIAPGSLISIFGTGLASGLTVANSVTLSTKLGDVDSVTINGVPAPLKFVSGGQINAQAPWNLIFGPANVVVTRGGVASQPVPAQVAQFSPALYGFNLGTPQAVAVNADGTVAANPEAFPGITSHPASAGDTVILYASGLGPVDQPPANGVDSLDKLRPTTLPVGVLLGSVPAEVAFAGLSPQFIGVYQINMIVPGGATPGAAVPIQLQTGSVTSADTLSIAVQ